MAEDVEEGAFSAEAFMRDMLTGLVPEGDPNEARLKSYLQERARGDRQIATKINRLFRTKDGADVLEWMIALTLRRREVSLDLLLGGADGERIKLLAVFRAGQNSVPDMILDAMAQAESRKRKRRDPL